MNLAEALDTLSSGIADAFAENEWQDQALDAIEVAARSMVEARQLVDTQAENEGLWFVARTGPEAYLQEALRKLHAVIEGEPTDR